LRNDGVAFLALDVRNEAKPARIMLMCWVVHPLSGRGQVLQIVHVWPHSPQCKKSGGWRNAWRGWLPARAPRVSRVKPGNSSGFAAVQQPAIRQATNSVK